MKIECRDISWFKVKKPLHCRAVNDYIYANRKNEVKYKNVILEGIVDSYSPWV